LVRTRPEKGLLGGMTEVPTTEWLRDFDETTALGGVPLKATWRRSLGVVTHTFTHFPLELAVYATTVAAGTARPAGMRWTRLADLPGEALPNVMRKVVSHVLKNSRE